MAPKTTIAIPVVCSPLARNSPRPWPTEAAPTASIAIDIASPALDLVAFASRMQIRFSDSLNAARYSFASPNSESKSIQLARQKLVDSRLLHLVLGQFPSDLSERLPAFWSRARSLRLDLTGLDVRLLGLGHDERQSTTPRPHLRHGGRHSLCQVCQLKRATPAAIFRELPRK